MKDSFVPKSPVKHHTDQFLLPKEETKKIHLTHLQPLPHTEARGTNTLTYSDTLQNNTRSVESNGNRNSDQNTVFRLTDNKTKVIGEEEENENVSEEIADQNMPESLVKSQNIQSNSPKFNGDHENANFTKSDFIKDPKKTPPQQRQSEPLAVLSSRDERNEFEAPSITKPTNNQKKIETAAFKNNWFEYLTEDYYFHMKSLMLKVENIDYNIPFGLAKLILSSYGNMQIFLHKTMFKKDNDFEFDKSYIETMIQNPYGPQEFINDEYIVLNHFEVYVR